MSNVPEKDLIVYKGQNKNFIISMLGITGGEDLAGDTVIFYVYESGNTTPFITKSSVVGVTEVEFTGPSEVTVKLVPADTSSLEAKSYFYQLWHTDVGGDIVPALTGFFRLLVLAPSIIKSIRNLLDEAGEVGVRQMRDEIIPPTSAYLVYANRRRVRDIQGVWLLTDTTHALTNYYTGGGFDPESGEIRLGSSLPSLVSDVRVDFSWESGIDDDAIQSHLDTSRRWAIGYTNVEFNYNDNSTEEKRRVEDLAIARTVVLCILTINGANVAQFGYNFRLGDFEIQSKLWGEGMIAQALFQLYVNMYEEAKQTTGRYIYTRRAKKLEKQYNLTVLLSTSQSGNDLVDGTLDPDRTEAL